MKTVWKIAVAVFLPCALADMGHAKPASFSDVPANIADAPVGDWLSVERRDEGSAYRWRAVFDGGAIWVSELHAGRYWPAARYQSESGVLEMLKKGGHSSFKRVEDVRAFGSKWGYMALSSREGWTCIAGIILANDNHGHDGEMGGTLRAYVTDCGRGVEDRFGDWKTWFRSFKRVSSSYNAGLEKSTRKAARTGDANRRNMTEWEKIEPSEIIINLADLDKRLNATFEQRVIAGGRLNQRVAFLQRNGGLFIERTPDIFTHRLSMLYDSRESFLREARKIFERRAKRGATVDFGKVERIRAEGDRSGHVAAVKMTSRRGGRDCIVGGVLFLGEGKRNPAADERFDTRVMLRDCSGERSFERIADWLRGVKIAPEGYNRGLGG